MGQRRHKTPKLSQRLQTCLQQPTAAPTLHHQRVAVIGAGLAGCCTARALAERGLSVDIWEQNRDIALQASGNRKSIAKPLSGHPDDPLVQFYRYAFSRLQSWLTRYGQDLPYDLGVMEASRITAEKASRYHPGASWQTAATLAHRTAVAIQQDGLWLPHAIVLSPRDWCHSLIAHPRIQLHLRRRFTAKENTINNTYDAVIYANAHEASTLFPQLQLHCARTQITLCEATNPLQHALSGHGYIIPTQEGCHLLGASHCNESYTLKPNKQDDTVNMDRLSFFIHAPKAARIIANRVALRANTIDHLPLAGNMAINTTINNTMQTPGGVVQCIVAGLGSRGLVSAPVCAELVAAQLYHEPHPYSTALHPLRHYIKSLLRFS